MRTCNNGRVNEQVAAPAQARFEAGNKRKIERRQQGTNANGRWEYYECWAGKGSAGKVFSEKLALTAESKNGSEEGAHLQLGGERL